ncbi:MAG TPA: aromatic ring-hydroxylating dioxygenase subunit alpha [Candidatus Kapabacteria bacterium]|nr:aromatic ring-hydroxylating dioxygenase subunit alpha [Candidatus Kapabacteria bacterium]
MSSIIQPTDLRIHPLPEAETIPSLWYTSEEIFAIEKEKIFAHSWQCLGRTSQVLTVGDYFLADIAGDPIIVIRGKDGLLRAFYNVCRHRGGPLATSDGCVSHLQCQYHGWTYDLDGQLKGVPSFDGVLNFDKPSFGLVPIELTEWEGFIFIRLEADTPLIEELLTGIPERIGSPALTELQFHSRISYDVHCNWKLYVDNYLEGYHVPIVHPELMKLYDYRNYRTEVKDWYSFQHSPLNGTQNIYSSGEGEALYYFIYPNLMLNILPGRLQTNLVQPIDATHCRVIFDYFYLPGTSEKMIIEDQAFSDMVQAEDIGICELVQRGVQSRSYDKGRFSVLQEEAVWHFQTLVKKALGSVTQ